MGSKSYEELDVWKKGFAAAVAVYKWTRQFPPDERFGLSIQMRRASSSIPANIAEGFARRSPRDKARFYNIAEGSAEELAVFVRLAAELGCAAPPPELRQWIKDTAMMLRRLTDVTLGQA